MARKNMNRLVTLIGGQGKDRHRDDGDRVEPNDPELLGQT